MNLWVRTYSYEYSTKKKLYFRSVDFLNKYKCYRYFFIIKLARPSVQSASVCVKSAAIYCSNCAFIFTWCTIYRKHRRFLLSRWWLQVGLEPGPAIQQAGVLTNGLRRTLIDLRRTLTKLRCNQQSHPAVASFKHNI